MKDKKRPEEKFKSKKLWSLLVKEEKVPKRFVRFGADSIQLVINSLQQECGTIVYEKKSKNNKRNFSNEWIDKLKQDQITCKADIAVLVTRNNAKRHG